MLDRLISLLEIQYGAMLLLVAIGNRIMQSSSTGLIVAQILTLLRVYSEDETKY